MSEEEKKAIEILRTWDYYCVEEIKEDFEAVDNAINTILNLTEKQQIEIEELKKDKKALVKNYDKVLGNFISKDEIKFYYKKICASVNHFQNKNDNNIVLRIKEYLEELLEEKEKEN